MSQRPFKILGIEHVGIAVENHDGISNIFSDILGLGYSGREWIEDQQVNTSIFDTGRGKLEFLQSTNQNSPIARFIRKKGVGIHHIALLVDNLQEALNYLNEKGLELIDNNPRIGADGYNIAFLHPKSTGGILVELCEKNNKYSS